MRSKPIDNSKVYWYKKCSGAVAQLGERMTGSHEVEGSTPFSSTSYFKQLQPSAILNNL